MLSPSPLIPLLSTCVDVKEVTIIIRISPWFYVMYVHVGQCSLLYYTYAPNISGTFTTLMVDKHSKIAIKSDF